MQDQESCSWERSKLSNEFANWCTCCKASSENGRLKRSALEATERALIYLKT